LKNSKEWILFYKSKNRPGNLPTIPNIIYKNKGWISLGHFLGNEQTSDRYKKFLNFEDARKLVHDYKFKNVAEYREWSKKGLRPINIPAKPDKTYNYKGYISWDDWLGTRIGFTGEYLTFNKAKEYLKTLNLKTSQDWKHFCNSGEKPDNIPLNPRGVYKNKGWVSMSDFLSVNEGYMRGNYMPFNDARNYIRTLKLKLRQDWVEYTKSGKKPASIPSEPEKIYKGNGFLNYSDWLGSEYVSNFNKEFLTYSEAKKNIEPLKIKSETEWRIFAKSPNKPKNIPSSPPHTYKKTGWKGWADFLGKE
jgi:hypothetical protein